MLALLRCLSLMYSYTGGRAVRRLPISISLIRSLSLSRTHSAAALSLSHTYFHTGGRAVRVYFSLLVRRQSLSRSLTRMAAGLVAVAQPFRIAVFAGVVRCGRVRVLV